MTGLPTVVRKAVLGLGLRRWSIAAFVLGVLLGGTALAVAGSDEVRRVRRDGRQPDPGGRHGLRPTSFRVARSTSSATTTRPGGSKHKKGYADGALPHEVGGAARQEPQGRRGRSPGVQPQQYAKRVKKASSQYDIFPGYIETVGFLRNSIAWRKDKFRLVSTTWIKLPYFHGDVLRMPWSCSSPCRPASRSTS